MEAKTYLEHYRLVVDDDGKPRELTRNGDAVTYRAIDQRSGESAAFTRLPISAIPSDLRASFEERARATQELDHPNIAKLLAFGTGADDFILVSEFLQGETIGRWVALRGPLPPDAALRTALQITNALSAAGFQGLNHPAIQPSNVMIVPGQATEGGWPYVKVMNFALAGIKLEAMPQFASPEQLKGATVDFRSEVYSIGAIMWFMLTGAIPGTQDRTAEARLVRKLPKPVRGILARTLQPDPIQRPDTPMAFTDEILDALGTVDKRQALGKKLGIPIAVPMTAGAAERRWGLPVKLLAIAAALLALLAVGAVLRPDRLLRKDHSAEIVGVPIGQPEATPVRANEIPREAVSSSTIAPENVAAAQQTAAPVQPAATPVVEATPAQVTQTAVAPPSPPEVAESATNQPVNPPPANRGVEIANAQGQAVDDSRKVAPAAASTQSEPAAKTQSAKSTASRKSDDETSSSVATKRRAKASRDSNFPDEAEMPPLAVGSMRAKFVGTTPDGKWILALPNSETVTVPPPPVSKRAKEAAHRRIRRALPVEDEPMLAPEPVYVPPGN